jgi:hypothetical protein
MCLFRCKKFSCKKICALRGLCVAIDNLCHSIDSNSEEIHSAIEFEDLIIQLSEVFVNWKQKRDEYRSKLDGLTAAAAEKSASAFSAFSAENVGPIASEEITWKAEGKANQS